MSKLIEKIVTGGQTGVDRAAMDVAIELGIPYSGWCPKGRLAEDGILSNEYNLKETPTSEYSERTEWNARDSDGTFVLNFGELSGGTKLTEECAFKYKKPYILLQAEDELALESIVGWVKDNKIKILNIAGPRESHQPGIVYSLSKKLLKTILTNI